MAKRMVVFTLSPNVALVLIAILALQFVPLVGALAALAFMVSAVAFVARKPGAIPGELLQQVGLCVLVLWCLLSVLWSDFPGDSLRHGLQLALTVVFAIALAQRLPPLVLLKILAACFLIACAASLVSGRARADGLGFLGIYGSKNAMAAASSLLFLIGICLGIDRRLPNLWRALGAVGLMLGGFLLVRANSVGSAVATAAICLALIVLLVLRRLDRPQRLILGTLTGLALVVGILLSLAYVDQISSTFVHATGKDLSLTGRTELWKIALHEIAARPIFGAGFQAVWVPGNPLAEALWQEFGIETRTGFHFHNAYLSNAVEIGITGAALQAVLVLGALFGTLSWVIRDLRAETLFLALLMVRQITLSLIEVPFFFQFDVGTILTVAAIVYVRKHRSKAQVTHRPAGQPVPA